MIKYTVDDKELLGLFLRQHKKMLQHVGGNSGGYVPSLFNLLARHVSDIHNQGDRRFMLYCRNEGAKGYLMVCNAREVVENRSEGNNKFANGAKRFVDLRYSLAVNPGNSVVAAKDPDEKFRRWNPVQLAANGKELASLHNYVVTLALMAQKGRVSHDMQLVLNCGRSNILVGKAHKPSFVFSR
jgi:hypothetical protein